jgi:hypothetical protein
MTDMTKTIVETWREMSLEDQKPPVLAFKPSKICGVGSYLNNVNKGTLKNP